MRCTFVVWGLWVSFHSAGEMFLTELLLAHGAHIDQRDMSGNTPRDIEMSGGEHGAVLHW